MKKRTSSNGKKPTRVFNIRLEEGVLEALRDLATGEHRTVTNLVQLMVAEGIAHRYGDDDPRK